MKLSRTLADLARGFVGFSPGAALVCGNPFFPLPERVGGDHANHCLARKGFKIDPWGRGKTSGGWPAAERPGSVLKAAPRIRRKLFSNQ